MILRTKAVHDMITLAPIPSRFRGEEACIPPKNAFGGGEVSSVGWQRRCKTRFSLRELDHQGTVFFRLDFHFLAITEMAVGLNRVVRSGEP